MGSKWSLYGVQVESIWSSNGVYVESKWSTWSPSGVYKEFMRSKWSLCGVFMDYVESRWSPSGIVGECKIQYYLLILLSPLTHPMFMLSINVCDAFSTFYDLL